LASRAHDSFDEMAAMCCAILFADHDMGMNRRLIVLERDISDQ
jgi:hypothetical protein